MRTRKPIKGELNYEIQRIMKRGFKIAGGDMVESIAIVKHLLKKLPKKWGVIETIVAYDTELTPVSEGWKPGPMTDFVESIRVISYRIRPNRTKAEHKTNMVYWPHGYLGLDESGQRNPAFCSIVNDPYHEVSVLKKKR